MRQETGLS